MLGEPQRKARSGPHTLVEHVIVLTTGGWDLVLPTSVNSILVVCVISSGKFAQWE